MRGLPRFFAIVLATLREVFDEHAYERFLQRSGHTTSAESYREFLREREAMIANRIRCC